MRQFVSIKMSYKWRMRNERIPLTTRILEIHYINLHVSQTAVLRHNKLARNNCRPTMNTMRCAHHKRSTHRNVCCKRIPTLLPWKLFLTNGKTASRYIVTRCPWSSFTDINWFDHFECHHHGSCVNCFIAFPAIGIIHDTG